MTPDPESVQQFEAQAEAFRTRSEVEERLEAYERNQCADFQATGSGELYIYERGAGDGDPPWISGIPVTNADALDGP